MRTLGNIIWHVPYLGFISAIGVFLIGGLFSITVVGAPIGFGLIQLSKCLLAPFSSTMINNKDLKKNQNRPTWWKIAVIIVSILYFPFGIFLAIVIVFQIVASFVTLIGIPVAIVLAKSLRTYINPVNMICVPKAVADELKAHKAKAQVAKYLG